MIKNKAIIGTNFSVTDAILCIPPRTINAVSIATIIPTTILGTPKALFTDIPIELDCTISPVKQADTIIEKAKNAANFLLPNPSLI